MTDDELEAIRARVDATTQGPWHWAGNTDIRHVYLATWIPGMGRCTIMDFSRWGMNMARPRFHVDHQMYDGETFAQYEVCHDAPKRDDSRVYRADIDDLRHPDAHFIASAHADVATLLAEVDRLRAIVGAA